MRVHACSCYILAPHSCLTALNGEIGLGGAGRGHTSVSGRCPVNREPSVAMGGMCWRTVLVPPHCTVSCAGWVVGGRGWWGMCGWVNPGAGGDTGCGWGHDISHI